MKGKRIVLTVRMFGPFQIIRDGLPVAGMSLRASQLLALLLLRSERELAKSWVADTIWMVLDIFGAVDGDEEDRQRRQASFRQALADLNRALEGVSEITIEARYGTVKLRIHAADIDLIQFDSEIENGKRGNLRAYEQACLACHAGVSERLLEGWEAVWIDTERDWRSREYLRALAALAEDARGQQQHRKAAYYCERAVSEAPDQLALWVALMEDYLSAAEPIAVLSTYKRFQIRYGRLLDTGSAKPDRRMQDALRRATQLLQMIGSSSQAHEPLEPAGGGLAPSSRVYLERDEDTLFHTALERQDGLILVKGPRQVGKTSLLTRGRAHAGLMGARAVWTDLQSFDEKTLSSPEHLYRAFARSLQYELEGASPIELVWNKEYPPNENLARFLQRQVLPAEDSPLVWILDEVDRLFACPFKNDLFGWFRALFNKRQSCAPAAPLRRLVLVFAYATEARLLITDPNMSPFNVGTHLSLTDFSLAQTAELNDRYRSPLHGADEILRFFELAGGHPYLTCRGLFEMATRALDLNTLEEQAAEARGVFGDHLLRLETLLAQNPALMNAVLDTIHGRSCPSPDTFLRLQSGGVLIGDAKNPKLRCQLYRRFLEAQFR